MVIYQHIKVFEQMSSFRSLIYYEKTMVLWKKLWYYGQNNGIMAKIMVLYRELLNFDLQRKKDGRLPKTKKLWFIKEKLWLYTKKIEVFWQIWSSRTLIYYGKPMGKTMVLWKNYSTMEKNYGTLLKTMELWFTMEKTMVQWKKNYGTIVNFSLL